MKKWLLLLVLVLLFVFLAVRERYTNYEEALADVGQTAGYITPRCEDGYTMNADQSECTKTKEDGTVETKPPTCPATSSFVKRDTRGVCEPISTPTAAETTTSTPATTPAGPAAGPAAAPAATAAQTGTSTGGSSTSTRGSTATTGTGKGVWGPAFVGTGGDGTSTGGDSTKTTEYPTLLGGFAAGGPSTRIEGVGVVPPSTPGLSTSSSAGGASSLPSSASMGSDANSRYLPYSRQPGDMDLVPDPYRLSRSYSTSNYSSSRSEPVPFLTDFSAFMK